MDAPPADEQTRGVYDRPLAKDRLWTAARPSHHYPVSWITADVRIARAGVANLSALPGQIDKANSLDRAGQELSTSFGISQRSRKAKARQSE